MIAYLKGKILYVNAASVVIDVAGVGYQVFVTTSLLEKCAEGAELEVHTFHYLREDSVELYGFEKKAELDFFRQLLTVSGVGPRIAMAILSNLKLEQIKKSIITNDASLIESVSGVGHKTAGRIILDLKNKIIMDDDGSSTVSLAGGSYQDVVEALVGLGYSQREAVILARKVPQDIESIEEKIKFALKHGSKNN